MRLLAARALMLFTLAAVAGAGCQGDGRKPTFKVYGRVTFRGQGTAGARVAFIPTEVELLDASPMIRPNARCDGAGYFAMTTYLKHDGAPAGDYRVIVFWDKNAPADDDDNDDDRPPVKNALPAVYGDHDKTPLQFTVMPVANEANFDLK